MFSERLDSINEIKNHFVFENNETFSINENFIRNLSNIYCSLNEIEEDKETLKIKNIPPSYYCINKKGEEYINKREGIPSELRIKENENTVSKNDNRYDFLNKIIENNEEYAPSLYSFHNILDIFKKNDNKNKFKEIIKMYSYNEEIKEEDNLTLEKKNKITLLEQDENVEGQLKDKRNQNDKIENNRKIKIKLDNSKRGRKTNEIKNIAIHNKMTPDNIIKKIKAKIFEYPILFLNNILGNKKTGDKLFKIDYQFINRINREQDLKFLDMKLKELFSKEISPKYITDKRHKDFNNQYINRILKNQKDNTILFVFNITFRDGLDLFTIKKNIKQLISKYDYSEKDIDCERIQKSLYGVNNLLNKIMNDNDKEYLTMLIFLQKVLG